MENRMIQAKVLTLEQDETTSQLLNQRKLFSVTASICMTKSRDTFEEMMYTCSSMGVNKIIPIMTEKKQHAEYFENKKDRLEKIMISAVEQSKQFYGMPEIASPLSIQDYCKQMKEQLNERRVFLDVDGEKPWLSLLNEIEENKQKMNKMNINLLVGPERDLFDQERAQLAELGFESLSLARKIVYRSEVALSVSLGSITSVIWNK
ncbi:predicted protein [Naegleria gruberi]|uniref:16S rRNA (uracil(1498)-N(3))-methyltransferase n=1 Tax=Naegleria gruberi TaxID=5762 RepID=D2VCW3_NAEGR|nr:uncharacterized protein NAEGRDRAFT_66713 [Naegleria gruberi]EFC45491.1 predicted protein [Naegleria gruberi]|eukprot:XP_002678235.1 predicted protein [Naegleria gruberi strain NEG-M]